MSALRVVRYVAWGAIAVFVIALGYSAWQWQQSGGVSRLAATTIGGPFTLTDQNGNTVTEAALKGHPSAIFFGYTFCPDVCPTTLFEMTGWLDKLGPDADKLGVYFVSVDPERDTQEMLSEYLTAFDPRITGLTGSPEAIAEIIKGYRVFARKVPLDSGGYLMDHTATIYLLDSNGTFTGTIDYQEDPETALKKLQRLVDTS
jgi:protein SCO1/2